MSGHFTNRREEIDRVFGRALPWVDSALTGPYRLSRADAAALERGLYEWFHGFARRPGSPTSDEALRPHLLLMACQAGHVYWTGKMAETSLSDENVKRALALGPHQIAIEIENGLQEKGKGEKLEKEEKEEEPGKDR